MATDAIKRSISLVAAAAIGQYRFGVLSGDDEVTQAAAATAPLVGVCQNKPDAAGKAATITVDGITKLIAGAGGLAANQIVTSDANGAGVVATTGQYGRAIVTKGAAEGEVAEVLLIGITIAA